MISSLAVKNFQSLGDIKLELAPFTVIVGPSSSGKSAATRSLRTLTSNARGDSFISHGEQTATITAHTDRGIVSLSRGKVNQYTIITPDGEKKNFTKLAGAVPEEVSEALGIPAKDPLNYSNQFDMPYLLTATAGEVARTLGELTNVSVIFDAAREANRQRLAASAKMKTRYEDYGTLTKNLDSYRTLKTRQAALEQASEHYTEALGISGDITRLTSLTLSLENAETRIADWESVQLTIPDLTELETTHERLKRLSGLTVSLRVADHNRAALAKLSYSVPDLTKLQQAAQKLARIQTLITRHQSVSETEAGVTYLLAEHEREISELQTSHAHILSEAGTCPTCGQSTERIAA